jgi:hypothetical protein
LLEKRHQEEIRAMKRIPLGSPGITDGNKDLCENIPAGSVFIGYFQVNLGARKNSSIVRFSMGF